MIIGDETDSAPYSGVKMCQHGMETPWVLTNKRVEVAKSWLSDYLCFGTTKIFCLQMSRKDAQESVQLYVVQHLTLYE
jgi:hypothetical protein